MKKRILALIVCAFLVLGLLAGCGSNTSSNTGSNTENSGSTSQTVASTESNTVGSDPASDAISKRIADAKKSGQYPKVVMSFMNFSGTPTGVKDVETELNKYTEEKLGLDVGLLVLDSASYKQQMTLMLSSGEAVDIFNVIGLGFSNSVNTGFTLDMEKDDLMTQYGQGIINTLDKRYVDGCRVNGVLYGLPQQRDMAQGQDSFVIAQQFLDGIGYDYKSLYKNPGDEVIKTDVNTINDIFAKLHQKYPDKVVYVPGTNNLTQGLDFDSIGGDNFGVLLNKAQELKVQDLFSSDSYKNFVQRYYDWNKAGYISKDAMTNDVSGPAQIKANSAMSYGTAGKPGIRSQESGLIGQPAIIFQLGADFSTSSYPSGLAWAINSKTKDPVATMQFMNAAYTDPIVSNLLCWGREGKEYKVTSDGHIDFADGVDASNSAYYNNVNWEMPNQFIAHIFAGNDLDVWDRTKEFNTNAIASKAIGFTFDNSSLTTEFTALSNIYTQYQKQLEFGFTDPNVGIPEMVNKMKSAGLEKYIAEKQSQIDAWLSKK